MRVTVERSLMHADLEFRIQINQDEITQLPGWCVSMMKDIDRWIDDPSVITEVLHTIACQIHKTKRLLDTPPTLEGTLKAETNEVGSGTAGETVDVRDTIVTAPETYGASVPEGNEKNGGVVQRDDLINAQKLLDQFRDRLDNVEGWLDDLDYKVARLETWALNVSGARDLVPRHKGRGEE